MPCFRTCNAAPHWARKQTSTVRQSKQQNILLINAYSSLQINLASDRLRFPALLYFSLCGARHHFGISVVSSHMSQALWNQLIYASICCIPRCCQPPGIRLEKPITVSLLKSVTPKLCFKQTSVVMHSDWRLEFPSDRWQTVLSRA